MCGIAGFHIRRIDRTAFDPSRLAAELLLAIDHRGGDATGYAAFDTDGGVQMQKAACKAEDFLTGCRDLPRNTRTAILHTRFATQGKAAFPENNHPVTHGPIYVTHNGHINNDTELFHGIGVNRMGYVDSEIIPALIFSEGWENLPTALEQLDGSFALAIANAQLPGELVLAKGEWSPLTYYMNENIIVWASEITALERAWKNALGTLPSKSRGRFLVSGDILRCAADGSTRFERFKPIAQYVNYGSACNVVTTTVANYLSSDEDKGYGTSWKPNLSDDGEDENGSFIDQRPIPTRLEDALAIMEARKRGDAMVWDTKKGWTTYDSSKHTVDEAWIRCACCNEFTDPPTMHEGFNELLCAECFTALVEDEILIR